MAKKKLTPQGGRTTKNRRKQRVVAPVQRRAGAPAGKPRAPKKSNASQAGRRQFSSKKKEENKKAAPCKAKKKGRDGEKLDPKAQQTAKNPFKKSKQPVQRNNVPHEPIGIALTVPHAADAVSGTGSPTDPSKKVGHVANTGAQNGSTAQQIMDRPFEKSVQEFIEKNEHGVPMDEKSVHDLRMTARKKKQECMKNWQREK